MIELNTDISCCGITEITHIGYNENNPEKTIIECAYEIFGNEKGCAFILFSDINKKKAGRALEKYIKKNKLGEITKTKSKINPNSKNSLTAWIWAINRSKLKNLYEKGEKEEKGEIENPDYSDYY